MKYIIFFIFISISIFIYLLYLQEKNIINNFFEKSLSEEIIIKEQQLKDKIEKDKIQIRALSKTPYILTIEDNNTTLVDQVLSQFINLDKSIERIIITKLENNYRYIINKELKISKSKNADNIYIPKDTNILISDLYSNSNINIKQKDNQKVLYDINMIYKENNNPEFLITITKDISDWLNNWRRSNEFDITLIKNKNEFNPENNKYLLNKRITLNEIDYNLLVIQIRNGKIKAAIQALYKELILITIVLFLILSPLIILYTAYTRKLNENVKTFELLFNNTFDSVILTDTNGIIKTINKISEAMYDIAIKDVVGKNIEDILSLYRKENGTIHKINWKDIFSNNKKEVIALYRYNIHLYVNISINTILYQDKQHYVIRVRDLTKEYKFENIFSKVFEQAAVGMALVNYAGTFTKVNNKLSKIFGYNEFELLSQHFLDNINHNLVSKELENFENIKKGKIVNYNIVGEFYNKNGDKVWLSMTNSAIYDFDHKFDFMVMVVIDITENKKSLLNLKETKEILEESQNIAMIGNFEYIIYDNKFLLSPSLYRLFDIPPKDYNIETFLKEIKTVDIKTVTLSIAKSIREKDSIDLIFETNLYEKQFIHFIAKIEYDKNIFPIKIKGTCQNITKQKQIEIKEKTQERLLIEKSKLAAMGEMIGAIAHQWRQPLNMISLLINDISYAYKYNELDKNYLDSSKKEISNQLKFMSETIDGFRTFFKNNQERINVSLIDIIKEIKNIYWAQLKDADIILNINAKIKNKRINFNDKDINGYKDAFIIKCIPIDIKQAILTIVQNAKEQIDILEKKDINNKTIEITLIKTDNKFILTILDLAGGIDKNVINRIFEPYFSTKQSGTGLGLYITKIALEKNNNAHIYARNIKKSIDNNKYKGIQFTIKLASR